MVSRQRSIVAGRRQNEHAMDPAPRVSFPSGGLLHVQLTDDFFEPSDPGLDLEQHGVTTSVQAGV
jgi:hypothetical protein